MLDFMSFFFQIDRAQTRTVRVLTITNFHFDQNDTQQTMQHIKAVFVGDSQVGKTYLLNSSAGIPLTNDDPYNSNQSIILTVNKHSWTLGYEWKT